MIAGRDPGDREPSFPATASRQKTADRPHAETSADFDQNLGASGVIAAVVRIWRALLIEITDPQQLLQNEIDSAEIEVPTKEMAVDQLNALARIRAALAFVRARGSAAATGLDTARYSRSKASGSSTNWLKILTLRRGTTEPSSRRSR